MNYMYETIPILLFTYIKNAKKKEHTRRKRKNTIEYKTTILEMGVISGVKMV